MLYYKKSSRAIEHKDFIQGEGLATIFVILLLSLFTI